VVPPQGVKEPGHQGRRPVATCPSRVPAEKAPFYPLTRLDRAKMNGQPSPSLVSLSALGSGSFEMCRGPRSRSSNCGSCGAVDRITNVTFRSAYRYAGLLGGLILATAMADAWLGHVNAQSRLDARYSVTLAGLPVGRGTWTIEIGDDQFSSTADGATAGLMRIFASGRGHSTVRGSISAGQPTSSNYASSIYTDTKYDEVRMVISAGVVKEFSAEPPNTPNATRVPVTEAHRRGVSDPMTASLVRLSGSGETVVPQACQRTLSIFDGRMRYDLQLGFKRFETVSSEAGYQGPVVVCSVNFLPLAGHVPERYALRYLMDSHDIELWLAPIAGTRIVVPYRISIPTPIGVGVMEATQFVAMPHAGKTTAKTQ